jgi:acetylglutamate kinase
MEKLTIIKIGGNVIDNEKALQAFLSDFAALPGKKILVHGGGKIATEISASLGISAQLVEGRRITDAETLKVVTMVYAGLINKNIVASLQKQKSNAIGLTGADGNFIAAQKRPVKDIDYGFVGDLNEHSVAANNLNSLLLAGFTPIFCAITHNGQGQLLNTNADTIASALAQGMSAYFTTDLVYCFEKKGVLKDVNDDNSIIRKIHAQEFDTLKADGTIADGMIPKLKNAFEAITNGVNAVFIGKADELSALNGGVFGTQLRP